MFWQAYLQHGSILSSGAPCKGPATNPTLLDDVKAWRVGCQGQLCLHSDSRESRPAAAAARWCVHRSMRCGAPTKALYSFDATLQSRACGLCTVVMHASLCCSAGPHMLQNTCWPHAGCFCCGFGAGSYRQYCECFASESVCCQHKAPAECLWLFWQVSYDKCFVWQVPHFFRQHLCRAVLCWSASPSGARFRLTLCMLPSCNTAAA